MKKLLIILAILLTTALCAAEPPAYAPKPIKHEVKISIKYNSITMEEFLKILNTLDQLKRVHRPCTFSVELEEGGSSITFPSGSQFLITD